MWRSESRPVLAALVAALMLALPLAAQQVEEEDLVEPSIWQELGLRFIEAEEIFDSAAQRDSVPLIGQFLAIVEENRAIEEPPTEILDLVVRAFFMRAQVNFNLGSSAEVARDLRSMLELDPGFTMDRGLVSSRLVDLFEEIQRGMVGALIVLVEPIDAKIFSSRWQADENGYLMLPAGPQSVTIERPGYLPQEQQIEIQAEREITLDVTLERATAVLTVLSRQPAVDIFIDGQLRGQTATGIGGDPTAAGFVIDDLQIGSYELEARKTGFRTHRSDAEIPELKDYVVRPIDLVATSGQVVFENFPAGTVIRANGGIVAPEFGTGNDPQLTLPPGEYKLALAHPNLGLFETTVALADQERISVPVRLRPGLVLLGVLGSDQMTANSVLGELRERLSSLERWALIDRSELGEGILSAIGIDRHMLRTFQGSEKQADVNWQALQQESGEQAGGALYLLAVLSDDLLAESVGFLLWPSAPLPALPDIFQIAVGDVDDDPTFGRLDQPTLAVKTTLGAVIVDSAVNGRPVVMKVNEQSPAARAGLQPGDEISKIGGGEITSVADLRAEIERRIDSHARAGRTVEVEVLSNAGTRNVELAIELSPRILSLRASNILFAAAAHELAAEAQSSRRVVAEWIVNLNQAVILMRSGELENAIQLLRSIEAPSESTIGQGMIEYLLGVALHQVGGTYIENAIAFLSAAGVRPDARLFHSDGPLVAPRAKARLQAIN